MFLSGCGPQRAPIVGSVRMQRLTPILILICAGACSDVGNTPAPEKTSDLRPAVIGKLEDPNIREASGLARSQQQKNVLWVINDNGAKEWVHAINPSGKRIGEFNLKKSDNVDWEDLASFRIDDKPHLPVADIGDNDARYKPRTLYVVEEPVAAKKEKARVAWRVDFKYPDSRRVRTGEPPSGPDRARVFGLRFELGVFLQLTGKFRWRGVVMGKPDAHWGGFN